MTNILSINFNHDGSGVILSDGRVAAFVNTERFSRKKKHPGIRESELRELLCQACLSIGDIDHVMLCNLNNMDSPDIPWAHGSDLKETWLAFQVDEVGRCATVGGRAIPCTVNPPHHATHCSLAFYTSPFDSAVAFSADPTGWSAYVGRDRSIARLRSIELSFDASTAYSFIAGEMFGASIFGAGKVMGLAPYGRPDEDEPDYTRLQTMEDLYDLSNRRPVWVRAASRDLNATLAYHVQRGLEVQLTHVLAALYERARRDDIAPNLCLSGGTALNSVANQVAFTASRFERLHLHPACGDDGTAVGAALWHWHDRLGQPRRSFSNAELMYSVRSYDHQIDEVCHRHRDLLHVEKRADYCDAAAELIASGKTVGWFQGPSEVGPRALGNRSILADPRHPGMKDILNARVKFRESFRPFAPAVLNEHANEWFGLEDSPFMLRVSSVRRDGIPAVTHVDGTARIQTVTAADNPAFHAVITRFFEKTGVPLVLNTSFNIGGDPIVETPADAVASLLGSGLDCLVFKERIVRKQRAHATVA